MGIATCFLLPVCYALCAGGDGRVTVYIDLVFVLNLCVNFLLLRTTAQLGAAAGRWKRLLLASSIGAAYAVAVYLPPFLWLRHAGMKLVFAALMLLAAFGAKRSTLRLSMVFAAIALSLCGAVYGVQSLQGRPFLYRNSLFYPVSFASLLLTAFALSLACRLFLPKLTHAADSIIPMTLQLGTRSVQISALRDSGNTLTDPISGQSVLTAHWSVAKKLLAQPMQSEDFAAPAQLALRLKDYAPRLIPYRAVGVDGGLLLALACRITVHGKTANGLVAFSPTPLSDGGAYDALTGGSTYV